MLRTEKKKTLTFTYYVAVKITDNLEITDN